MHRSRLGALIIDCKTDNLDMATEFWSNVLGMPTGQPNDEDAGNYVPLANRSDSPHIETQKVDHPSRVHIDIETDDIDAEVSRLEKLGARRIDNNRSWVVMEAPTGHVFCIVPPQRAAFDESANTWIDE